MADVSHALEAKSDQLNATDIVGAEPILTIREVSVRDTQDQPVWIYYDGDNGRPWKPSKGMLRVLAAAWGRESDAWVGKAVQVYHEPDVMYAGEKVGGIRIKAMSDIARDGLKLALTLNRKKRVPYHVALLQVPKGGATYPQDKLDQALPHMASKLESGEMTLQQVIARCQQTAPLTKAQIKQIEALAPVEIADDDHDDDEGEQF